MNTTPTEKKLTILGAFADRRILVMLALGFSAGLPNLLVFDTLSAWLRDSGVSLEVIGFFSLATMAYAAKFLWAPLVDRVRIPFLTKWLGHRRSWMLVAQACVMLGLWLISGQSPMTGLGAIAAMAVFVGFSGATQDIVIDAWRIEAAENERQGAMAAAYQWGYRIAIVVAGAAPLLLAEVRGWNFSYAVMACLMLIGVLGVLGAPREKAHVIRPIHTEGVPARPVLDVVEWIVRGAIFVVGALIAGSGLSGNPTPLTLLGSADAFGLADAWKTPPIGTLLQFTAVVLGLAIIVAACWPIPRTPTRAGAYLSQSFGSPLIDFFQRYKGTAALILALICLYRLSDFVLNIMNPFYLDLGFSKVEIAEIRKVFGMLMSMLGVLAGGISVARLGLMRSLVIGAFAGPLSNMVFAWLAMRGHDVGALAIAIGFDNIAQGYSGTALIAYMSSLTGQGFTATQYALFSSLYALPGKVIATMSGRIVEGSARAAELGGPLAMFKPLFGAMTPGSLVSGAAKTGVSPAALGSGYLVFFLYSTVIGVFAVFLTFAVARREKRAAEIPPAEEPIA
ncbi:MFS transporter [Caulobacter sp. Root655]|uniref:AmpG family muropeptide MFS transporter n=1 Tax=Caulobacter sp. Root655 TaxID=1736578 RepID=UPI000AB65842|nr:MFS transporter [Caulobacter sp. Root655]